MPNLLVVEDNQKINDLITLYLSQEGHTVFSALSAEEGLEIFNKEKIDLMVTDLMLPEMSGEELVEEVRKKSDCYIIIVTAKIHIDDKLIGLKLGADDYIVKPFSTEELLLKIQNFLKRKVSVSNILSFYDGELVISKGSNIVQFKGNPVEFTGNEYLLLVHLASNKTQIYSREQLLDTCFNGDNEVFDRIIDVYIKNIRKKLQEDTKKPRYIKTIYGLGYMFVGELDD